MLHYDRIDVSEGTDVNKASESKECDMCRYWYFLHCSTPSIKSPNKKNFPLPMLLLLTFES